MTEVAHSKSWSRVEINLDNLRANYKKLLGITGPDVQVMAVVKADAYGHGMIEVAGSLAKEGATAFGVAETGEGVALRCAGIRGDIVILLGVAAENYDDVIAYDLTPVVYDREILKGLSGKGVSAGKSIPVHLKIDTGMGRLGILPHELSDYLDLLASLPGIVFSGVLSHFPMADSSDPALTVEQNKVFAALMEGIDNRFGKKVAHIANSAAIIKNPNTHLDMVRPGIALYGCCPSTAENFCAEMALQPVMSFHSRVIQVRDVPAGSGISYGHIYKTERPTKLAVMPVGYENGYLRKLSGRAKVLVGGEKVPVVGRICMNACMVDITGLDHVQTGDEVVLLGKQGREEITADEIASWLETISYEILCLIGRSNNKIYISN